jgi:hypothetical protein
LLLIARLTSPVFGSQVNAIGVPDKYSIIINQLICARFETVTFFGIHSQKESKNGIWVELGLVENFENETWVSVSGN